MHLRVLQGRTIRVNEAQPSGEFDGVSSGSGNETACIAAWQSAHALLCAWPVHLAWHFACLREHTAWVACQDRQGLCQLGTTPRACFNVCCPCHSTNHVWLSCPVLTVLQVVAAAASGAAAVVATVAAATAVVAATAAAVVSVCTKGQDDIRAAEARWTWFCCVPRTVL